MKKCWSGCSLLLVLVILGLLFQRSSPQVAFSQVNNDPSSASPPPQVVTDQRGLEKIAPDLLSRLGLDQSQSGSPAVNASDPSLLMVSALIEPGADVSRYFLRSVRSRQVGGIQWVNGEINPGQLIKLASLPQVQRVFSPQTFETQEAPGLEDLRRDHPVLDPGEARRLLNQGGPNLLRQRLDKLKSNSVDQSPSLPREKSMAPEDLSSPGVLDIHDVRSAWDAGYRGEDVVVAVVDTGVDFAHPDLQGAQAIISEGPYAGWPFAYDVMSGVHYALGPSETLDPQNFWVLIGETQFVSTLPVTDPVCNLSTCSARLQIGGGEDGSVQLDVSWPNTSKSGSYLYSIHPDLLLMFAAYSMRITYQDGWTPPIVIVSDVGTSGVYDTVYVDVNYNRTLGDPGEKMTQSAPLGGADLNEDETWDLSAGMLAWISDGVHHPPGVVALYPQVASTEPPGQGRLLAFINDMDGHGTNCASEIAGRAVITDPKGSGPTNPRYAGGADVGGVGTPVIPGVAPEATIAAFQNGFTFPLDAWTLAVYGMDEDQDVANGAQIISNSWGDSEITEDGWDEFSRFAHNISYQVSPSVSFLAATGNGGHGYGTETLPGGATIIDVGASTAYGQLNVFENALPEQFLSGDIQPWSNRGPGALGEIAPDVVAVGAWGTGAQPLNSYYGDGQAAYDVFGGTSMSTPIAAGTLALVYQAYHTRHAAWPSWAEARSILFNGAADLGYDVFSQGAGNVQAGRSVKIVADSLPWVEPQQWQPGRYRSAQYPAFPSLIRSGESDSQEFTIHNPTADPVNYQIREGFLSSVYTDTYSVPFSPPVPSSKYNLPVFLADITQLIDQNDPDLVRVQVTFPQKSFDVNGDGYADNWWGVHFYDWTDLNQDGNLWVDSNNNAMVDEMEIDFDLAGGIFEFNRFTYGYPLANSIEASLGRAAIAQKHDGVFLGLTCNYCGESLTLQVRLTFYEKTDWEWLSLSSSSLNIPAGGQAAFTATFSPTNASPGVYESAIELDSTLGKTILPVAALVVAGSETFQFGGGAAADTPYDNGAVFGGFNWNWRPESGDWRFYYYDIPDGTQTAGKSLLVDTRWSTPGTDIDTWVLGRPLNQALYLPLEIFGPQGLASLGGSENTHLGHGQFLWTTNTGTNRELVGLPLQDGLGAIALHNVLTGGGQPFDRFSGTVFQFTSTPGEVEQAVLPTSAQSPQLAGSQEITLTSTGDLSEGIQVRAYGLAIPEHLLDQPIRQDPTSGGCSSSWVYQKDIGGLKIAHGGLLEITTSSDNPDLDLDIYLFLDNGDGIWNCTREEFINYSISAGPEEHIKIYFPADGTYWIAVHGNYVPRAHPQFFDIDIEAIHGTGILLRGIPSGPVVAGQPVRFQAYFQGQYQSNTPAALQGMLLVGPPSVPTLIHIPINLRPTILIYPAPSLILDTQYIRQDAQLIRLAFQNQGTQDEDVQVEITLPAGLDYQPGTASGPGSIPEYDPASRTLTWAGSASAQSEVVISFFAAADPAHSPDRVILRAQIKGVQSEQEWNVSKDLWLNRYGIVLPVIRR